MIAVSSYASDFNLMFRAGVLMCAAVLGLEALGQTPPPTPQSGTFRWIGSSGSNPPPPPTQVVSGQQYSVMIECYVTIMTDVGPSTVSAWTQNFQLFKDGVLVSSSNPWVDSRGDAWGYTEAWSGSDTTAGGPKTVRFTAYSNGGSVGEWTVTIVPAKHTLTTSATAGGTISPRSGEYSGNITITATPDNEKKTRSFTVTQNSSTLYSALTNATSELSYTVNMDSGDVVASAIFQALQIAVNYGITVNAGSFNRTSQGISVQPNVGAATYEVSFSGNGSSWGPISGSGSQSFVGPVHVGTYHYTVDSATGYTGGAAGNFSITPAPVTFTFSSLNQNATGGALSPSITPSDQSATYNVTYNGSSAAPSAVGTYTVVATASGDYSGSGSANFTINQPVGVSASISASPTNVTAPGSSSISWASANATSVSISGPGLSSAATSGNEVVSGLSPGTYTYTITAQGAGGPVGQSATVTVTDQPVATVTASIHVSPVTATAPGSATVTWSSANATSVSVSGTGMTSSTATGGNASVSGLTAGTYTYTIVAQGQGGPVTQAATLIVVTAPVTKPPPSPQSISVWPGIGAGNAGDTVVLTAYGGHTRYQWSGVTTTSSGSPANQNESAKFVIPADAKVGDTFSVTVLDLGDGDTWALSNTVTVPIIVGAKTVSSAPPPGPGFTIALLVAPTSLPYLGGSLSIRAQMVTWNYVGVYAGTPSAPVYVYDAAGTMALSAEAGINPVSTTTAIGANLSSLVRNAYILMQGAIPGANVAGQYIQTYVPLAAAPGSSPPIINVAALGIQYWDGSTLTGTTTWRFDVYSPGTSNASIDMSAKFSNGNTVPLTRRVYDSIEFPGQWSPGDTVVYHTWAARDTVGDMTFPSNLTFGTAGPPNVAATGPFSITVTSTNANGTTNLVRSGIIYARTITSTPAQFSASPLTFVYDATAKAPVVSTTPAYVYYQTVGQTSAVQPGNYQFTVTAAGGGYTGSQVFNWSITAKPVTFTFGNLNPIYDGTPKAAVVMPSDPSATYTVTYAGAGGTTYSLGVTPPSAPGTYTVSAIATGNYSGTATATLTIARLTPIITWTAPSPITYGTPLGAAELNASADVPGTFGYSPAAGAILGAGLQTITAAFTPDNPNYNSATATAVLTVNPAALTVTANSVSRVYGTANPTFSATYAGFVNGDTVGSLTPPIASTSATVATGAGAYPIVLSGGFAANYILSLVPGTLTITKAPLTATADDQTKTFGSPNPPLTISYLGFQNGDTASSITSPTVSTVVTASSPVGSYPITLSGGMATNYAMTLIGGTLAVQPKPVTFTFGHLTATFDGSMKTATVTPSDLAATYAADLTKGPAAGAYTVSVRANGNYVGFGTDELTINRAPIVFKFGNLESIYDGSLKSAQVVPSDAHATYTTDLTKGPDAGTYVVSATATGDYSGSGTADLVISPAPQTISLSPLVASCFAGQPTTFTASGSGANCYTWGGDAATGSNASAVNLTFPNPGSYTVTVSSPASRNYLAANTATARVDVVSNHAVTAFTPVASSYSVSDANSPSYGQSYGRIWQDGGWTAYLGRSGVKFNVKAQAWPFAQKVEIQSKAPGQDWSVLASQNPSGAPTDVDLTLSTMLDSTAPGQPLVPASYAAGNPLIGNWSFRARVQDSNGGWSEFSTEVPVNVVLPVVTRTLSGQTVPPAGPLGDWFTASATQTFSIPLWVP